MGEPRYAAATGIHLQMGRVMTDDSGIFDPASYVIVETDPTLSS